MSRKPTGRVVGNELILTRTFHAPIEDVWTSITTSESCARWFGRWEGTPRVGETFRFQMVHEAEQPWMDVLLESCEPPRRLALAASFRLELSLLQRGDVTELTFVHHMANPADAANYGPGWEYYLDMLSAARAGLPLPRFGDYDPADRQHFLDQVPKG